MRLFIAAPLTPTVQAAITAQLPAYQVPGVRVVPMANRHLTLHFLGETPDNKLPLLIQQLGAIAASTNPFKLHFREIAPGPKLKSPRLVWVRFAEEPAYAALAHAVSQILPGQSNAHPDLIPHITIARLKKEQLSGPALPLMQHIDFPEYEVNTIALWQSKLGSPHPEYSVVQEFTLAAPH